MDVYQELDEALTGSRLERAKEKMQGLSRKDPKAKALKRVAGSQEGSNRGDTVPGDLPRDKSNTTLPTGRGGKGSKGRGKTVNRAPYGAPLGSGTGQSDRGKGNKAARRAGRGVDDTRYDEQVDIYDFILSHLLDEGYAETPEAAEAIMVNMSEEWKGSIVEEILDEELTGERAERAKEIMKGSRPYGRKRASTDAKYNAAKRALTAGEGSTKSPSRDIRGDEKLPTGRGGRGIKGRAKTVTQAYGGQSDRGRGNRATRRSGGDVEDTRYDD
jgi:hypothetical protein